MRFVVTLVVALLPGAAFAQDRAVPNRTAPPDARVCRTVPTSGSGVAKRECRTQAEWDKLDHHSAYRTSTDPFPRPPGPY